MMSEFNAILEFEATDLEALDDLLMEEFADFHPSVGLSTSDRVEVTVTIDATSAWAAVEAVRAVHVADDVVAVRVLPTVDYDELADLIDVPPLLSVTEAADELQVSRTRVQQLIDAGQLPARQVGRTWVVAAEGVARRAS